MSTTKLLLIRHGETEWSRDDRFTGISDIPLTDVGRQQALALAHRLAEQSVRLTALYSSPRIRSLETAQIIAECLRLDVQVANDLQEINYGVWEGLPRKEILTRYAQEYAQWSEDPATLAPPDGETGIALVQRVRPTLESLVKNHQGGVIGVVLHNTVNRLAICSFLEIPLRKYRQAIRQDTACLNILSFNDQQVPTLVKLNDVTHYQSALLPQMAKH